MVRGLTRRGGRLVVLSVAVLALAGACASEAGVNAGSSYGPYDSGTSYDAGGSDASFGDGGNNGDTGGMTPPTTALFVQASPSLPDVRLCWSTGGSVAEGGTVEMALPFPGSGAMPGSNYPGIPLGGGAGLSDVGDLATRPATLYAIDAENLARIEQGGAQSTCDALICNAGPNPALPCLRPNLDYWPVASLPAPLSSGTNVVALTGCLASALDPLASAARCGPTWTDVAGNLHAEVALLQSLPAAGDAGQLLAQSALLSPAIAAQLPDGGAVVVSFGSPDGGLVALGALTTEGQTTPAVSTLTVGTDLSAYGTLGFAVDVPLAGEGGAEHEWMTLAQAQQLVDPTEDPTVFFGQPRTYLVAVLGDPSAPPAFGVSGDGGYDGRGLHVLVLAAPPPPQPDAGDAGDAGEQ